MPRGGSSMVTQQCSDCTLCHCPSQCGCIPRCFYPCEWTDKSVVFHCECLISTSCVYCCGWTHINNYFSVWFKESRLFLNPFNSKDLLSYPSIYFPYISWNHLSYGGSGANPRGYRHNSHLLYGQFGNSWPWSAAACFWAVGGPRMAPTMTTCKFHTHGTLAGTSTPISASEVRGFSAKHWTSPAELQQLT